MNPFSFLEFLIKSRDCGFSRASEGKRSHRKIVDNGIKSLTNVPGLVLFEFLSLELSFNI